MIFQSKIQRHIVGAGTAIALVVLSAVTVCLLRGMRYDFDRGLVIVPKRNGASYGLGVCYRDGQPTLCYTNWRGDGSVSSTGFGRFRSWQSMWNNSDPEEAPYGEETEFYENGARKAFGIRQVKDGIDCVEIWGWHPNGAISAQFASRDSKIEGMLRGWYPSGQIKFEISMKAGKREGRTRWYDQTGHLIAQCVCKDDECLEGDYIIWYGDTGFDGDILFGPEDGREYVIKTKTSHQDGKLIREQIWNQQGELVGVGHCREGKEWDGVFSIDTSDDDSNTITDLSIWENGVEIAQIPFDPDASCEETQSLIADVRMNAVPQSVTDSGAE